MEWGGDFAAGEKSWGVRRGLQLLTCTAVINTGYSNLKTAKIALLKSVIEIDVSPYAMHEPRSEAVDFLFDFIAGVALLEQVLLEDAVGRDCRLIFSCSSFEESGFGVARQPL